MELNNFKKKLPLWFKNPIFWYFSCSILVLVILLFLLIGFNISSFVYGWLLGIIVSVAIFCTSYIFDKKINMNDLTWTKTYGIIFLQLFIKVGIFISIFLTSLIINSNLSSNTTPWMRFNYPISGIMIISNYIFYSIFNLFNSIFYIHKST